MQKRFLLSTQTIVQLSTKFSIIVLMLVSAACGVVKLDSVPDVQSSLPVADSSQMPDVVRQLVMQADQQFHAAQLQDAQATLERALRINPRQPEIWSRMANIYRLQGQTAKAHEYARRSNHYIRENPALRQYNDDIISSSNTGQ